MFKGIDSEELKEQISRKETTMAAVPNVYGNNYEVEL